MRMKLIKLFAIALMVSNFVSGEAMARKHKAASPRPKMTEDVIAKKKAKPVSHLKEDFLAKKKAPKANRRANPA